MHSSADWGLKVPSKNEAKERSDAICLKARQVPFGCNNGDILTQRMSVSNTNIFAAYLITSTGCDARQTRVLSRSVKSDQAGRLCIHKTVP